MVRLLHKRHLSTEKDLKVPTQPEKRERRLLALIQKCHQTVALFVDDAHGLHHRTLVGLKRLIELVRHNGGTLSVILAGHPKLKNDLKRPALEEIGGRTNPAFLTKSAIANDESLMKSRVEAY